MLKCVYFMHVIARYLLHSINCKFKCWMFTFKYILEPLGNSKVKPKYVGKSEVRWKKSVFYNVCLLRYNFWDTHLKLQRAITFLRLPFLQLARDMGFFVIIKVKKKITFDIEFFIEWRRKMLIIF